LSRATSLTYQHIACGWGSLLLLINKGAAMQTGQTNATIDRYIRLEKDIHNNAIVGMF